MHTRLVWAKNGESLRTITLGSSPFYTLDTFYFTGYVMISTGARVWKLRNQRANYMQVDSCVDLRPFAPLDRHDGSRMGINEHAPGCDYELRRDHDTALPCWSVRGWICPCCCPLHDLFLPSWRDGSSIWSLHLVLPTCQLLRLCPRIRPCSCQDIHTQLEASFSNW